MSAVERKCLCERERERERTNRLLLLFRSVLALPNASTIGPASKIFSSKELFGTFSFDREGERGEREREEEGEREGEESCFEAKERYCNAILVASVFPAPDSPLLVSYRERERERE